MYITLVNKFKWEQSFSIIQFFFFNMSTSRLADIYILYTIYEYDMNHSSLNKGITVRHFEGTKLSKTYFNN